MNKTDANGVLLEILLNQQLDSALVRRNIKELSNRVGGLSTDRILAYSDGELADLFAQKPAIHRFVNRMARQTRLLFTLLEQDYDGDARNVWSPPISAGTLVERLKCFPGIGERKATVGLFVLTREFGIVVGDDGGIYTVEGCEKLPGRFGGESDPLLLQVSAN